MSEKTKLSEITLKPMVLKNRAFVWEAKHSFEMYNKDKQYPECSISFVNGKCYAFNFDQKYAPDYLEASNLKKLLKKYDQMYNGFCESCEVFYNEDLRNTNGYRQCDFCKL